MFSWLCCKQNPEKRKFLETILPEGYQYQVSSFKIIEESEIFNENKFEVNLKINTCTEEELLQFLKDFHHSSSTNYNINRGDKRDGKNLILSGVRKCHHNVRKRF